MIRSVERQGSTKAQDGRTLTFIERGDPDGVPVIVCHGTPGSRYTRHPDPELYERHGTHFVAYDRPGYGGSDPQPGRSVAAAAGDIQAIADELGFERFAVVGGSGGAPHALACGALLGDRVTRVGALVTPAPSDAEEFDFFAGLAELNIKEFGAGRSSGRVKARRMSRSRLPATGKSTVSTSAATRASTTAASSSLVKPRSRDQ